MRAIDMQGACSSHDGINYNLSFSLSPTTDGNAYCNDNFHSSVQFVPNYPICNTKCCFSKDIAWAESLGAENHIAQYSPGLYKQNIDICQQQINDYQNKVSSYNQEIQAIQTASDNTFKQKLEDTLNKVNQKAQEQKDKFTQQQLQNQQWIQQQTQAQQQKNEVNQIVANFFALSTPIIASTAPSTGLKMPIIKKVIKKVQPRKIIIKKKKK